MFGKYLFIAQVKMEGDDDTVETSSVASSTSYWMLEERCPPKKETVRSIERCVYAGTAIIDAS